MATALLQMKREIGQGTEVCCGVDSNFGPIGAESGRDLPGKMPLAEKDQIQTQA